ncbi:chondroitinase family protein [Streptomyces sp. NPDC056708]|uniref:chondroitinase family protein n=1 Tax=unclassified Streptomyces TaxID=2593676 RepID=UPI0036A5DC10
MAGSRRLLLGVDLQRDAHRHRRRRALRVRAGEPHDCWFEFRLDFTGRRTAWVRYAYDMHGRPHLAMDTVRIITPRRPGPASATTGEADTAPWRTVPGDGNREL